jgi:hypothetical protein
LYYNDISAFFRQPIGSCPPVRPYIAETEASKLKRPDFPHGEDSWSPQPFRMASSGSPAKDIRRETFISSKKEAFDESNVNKENISSPRRDTFIVPKGLAISDETITIRRETFVSVNPRPMLTSTPRIGGGGQGSQANKQEFNFLTPSAHMDSDDRRQTYAVLPSTVKKPQLDMKRQKIEEEEEAEEEKEVKDDTLKQPEPEMVTEEKITETDVKQLSDIKEEESPGSKIPTDIEQLLQISDVDLSLSPEKIKKEDISGLDMIVDQTMSAPTIQTTSNARLQLSGGGNDDSVKDMSAKYMSADDTSAKDMSANDTSAKDMSAKDASSGTFVKDDQVDSHRVSCERFI